MNFRWILITSILFFSLNVSVLQAQGNRALSLDGSGDYVDCGQVLTGNGVFTAEAWINPTDSSEWNTIAAEGCAGSDLAIDDGTILFGRNCGGKDGVFYYGPSVTLNQWTHVAIVYDGTNLDLHTNGVKTIGGPVTYTHENLYIGSYNGINELFHGLIDDLRIWNVARTQEEIQATMYTELQGDEPGLVAYYRFNTLEDLDIGEEGFKVDDVRDWSGNDNHGDLVGDALLVDSTAPIDVTVIAGIISGAENGAGLSDVLVELLDNTESVVESTSTTANGYYRFDDIPEGQYRIRASKLFYHSTESERFDLASQEVEYVALTIQPEQGQYGLNLDGDGDYVEIPDDDSLDIADEITIETWFKYPGGMDDTHTWTTEFTLPYQGNQNPGNQRIA